jgi:hypothetical protein
MEKKVVFFCEGAIRVVFRVVFRVVLCVDECDTL